MPSDDYAPVVRGGLKLKGTSSPAGIKKKKKKPSTKPTTINEEELSKALSKQKEKETEGRDKDGEEEDLNLRELEDKDFDGKTATERAYEETRRKRVSPLPTPHIYSTVH